MSRLWWIDEAEGTPYGLAALPHGVFCVDKIRARVGVRIAQRVLDLSPLAAELRPEWADLFQAPNLNRFRLRAQPNGPTCASRSPNGSPQLPTRRSWSGTCTR